MLAALLALAATRERRARAAARPDRRLRGAHVRHRAARRPLARVRRRARRDDPRRAATARSSRRRSSTSARARRRRTASGVCSRWRSPPTTRRAGASGSSTRRPTARCAWRRGCATRRTPTARSPTAWRRSRCPTACRPTTTAASCRSGPTARSTSASATAAAANDPYDNGQNLTRARRHGRQRAAHPARQDPAHRAEPGRRLHDPGRQPVPRAGRRGLGRWGCATRTASRSTARPARWSSATWGRTRSRRSTSSRPASAA